MLLIKTSLLFFPMSQQSLPVLRKSLKWIPNQIVCGRTSERCLQGWILNRWVTLVNGGTQLFQHSLKFRMHRLISHSLKLDFKGIIVWIWKFWNMWKIVRPHKGRNPLPHMWVTHTHSHLQTDCSWGRRVELNWSEFTALESPGQCVVKSSAQVRYLYRPDLITLAQTWIAGTVLGQGYRGFFHQNNYCIFRIYWADLNHIFLFSLELFPVYAFGQFIQGRVLEWGETVQSYLFREH